jgi:hypothetical protein
MKGKVGLGMDLGPWTTGSGENLRTLDESSGVGAWLNGGASV